MPRTNQVPKIGIYAGSFDPVHGGHISFALQALQAGQLDEVCFVPERLPKDKPGTEHFGHRVAMLRQAIKPYEQFSILEVVDRRLSVHRTLSHLRQAYGESKLIFLMGTEVFASMPDWDDIEHLQDVEFIVGVRSPQDRDTVARTVERLGLPVAAVRMVTMDQPDISSGDMRRALQSRQATRGLLPSVRRYANRAWLYVRVR